MVRILSSIIILISLSSYKESGVGVSYKVDKIAAAEIKGVRFVVKAEKVNDKILRNTIVINAALYNDNIDAIYFPTTTCKGEQYSLRYDTAKFEIVSIDCNVSHPKLIRIAPKSHYDFQMLFTPKRNEIKIRLGFDFYAVSKSFDITKESLNDLKVFDRPKGKQTIVWADYATIK